MFNTQFDMMRMQGMMPPGMQGGNSLLGGIAGAQQRQDPLQSAFMAAGMGGSAMSPTQQFNANANKQLQNILAQKQMMSSMLAQRGMGMQNAPAQSVNPSMAARAATGDRAGYGGNPISGIPAPATGAEGLGLMNGQMRAYFGVMGGDPTTKPTGNVGAI